MTYQQKYLKYKSKYLEKKNSLQYLLNNSVQTGGNILDLDHLSDTPKSNQWNNIIQQTGGDILSVDHLSETPESDSWNATQNGGGIFNINQLSDTPNQPNVFSNPKNDIKKLSSLLDEPSKYELTSELNFTESQTGGDISENSSKPDDNLEDDTQLGGKTKNNKKHFFNDSDLELSSTTDSNLSSFDTDTTEDNI